jgi:hypothetical protein
MANSQAVFVFLSTKALFSLPDGTKVGDIEIQLPFWAPFHNSYTSFLIYFQPILLAQNGVGDLSEHILCHFISKI